MRFFWIAAVVVLIDQATKLAVVQTMHPRQSIHLVGDWLKLTFTENPGMAFGLTVGPDGVVAVFAILATILVIWYLWQVRNGYWPYVASLALILGGALGNIIDRVFYGVIFDYGPLFQGRVVDFIHVDIGYLQLPEAIPAVGGSFIALFPIWNVADMAIVGGVLGVLFFQTAFHNQLKKEKEEAKTSKQSAISGGERRELSGSQEVDGTSADETNHPERSLSPDPSRLGESVNGADDIEAEKANEGD